MLKFLSIGLCGVMLAMCAGSAGAAVTTEIVIVLDSSGSVYDSLYANWTAELDFARDLIDDHYRPDGSVAFGLINYSGDGQADYQGDIDAGRLKTEFGLLDYTSKADYLNYVGSMGESDFFRGFSHLDHALQMAANLFDASGRTGVDRYIVLFCDNGPYPMPNDPPYQSADSMGYVSDTLLGLRAGGVGISIISMTTDSDTFDDYILPVAESSQYAINLTSYAEALDYETQADSLLLPIPEPATMSLMALGGLAVTV